MPTLRLKWPLGQTVFLAIAWLGLLVGTAEPLARTEYARQHLPSPGLGSAHRQFEIQMDRLKTRVAQEGPVDCIVLGNSHVWRGFNPEAFGQYYQEATGQPIRCQNFGVRGINVITAGKLATLLVTEFHPRLLIYATSAGDFDPIRGLEANDSIVGSPWVQYHLGKPTLDGWLIENSSAYRYYLGLRTTLLPVSQLQVRDTTEAEEETQLNGFAPIPNFKIWHGIQEYVENYVVDPAQLAGLQEILALQTQTEILIVEMPVNPVTFKSPELIEKRDQFVVLTSETVGASGKQFWLTQNLNLIPDDAWADFHHLGKTGANIFSAWLGKRVGEAVMDGILRLPERSEP